jgi:altronate dehydratase
MLTVTAPLRLDQVARLPAPGDNVAIATRRLERGTRVRADTQDLVLDHTVMEGHRFAVRPIAQGEALLSWGRAFGTSREAIPPGAYVINAPTLEALSERPLDFSLPGAPNFENYIEPYTFDAAGFRPGVQVPPLSVPRAFQGYYRTRARGVGTRNFIVILGITSRAASFARALALRLQPRAAAYGNIDGIAAIAHTEGSGGDPLNNSALLLRTLAGLMVHPNVGAVMAVEHPADAIGRRELEAYLRAQHYPLDEVPHAWLTLDRDFHTDLERGAARVEPWFERVNLDARTPQSAAHLRIALQCGGSDAFSGISGNPLAGAVAREVVRAGGAANLAETDELVGAEDYVLQNVRDRATALAFLETVQRFKEWLGWHGLSPEGNPSGGNRYRGLYNITLKSLGAAMKKDPALRLDHVIDYGEPMNGPGFYFMNSPGNDLESVAGQVAAGCNLIFFVTGNGSVTNFPFVPTVKFVTTTGRYQLLRNEMDVNAGAYLDGTPLDELTRATFELTLRVAAGERTRGERAGHSQISIWRNWRQTGQRLPNVSVELPPPDGVPLAPPPWNGHSPILSFPITRNGTRATTEPVGLILPTSLCASEVARLAADRLNELWRGRTRQLARFVTLSHTEGCGSGGASILALYQRTMLNYMRHPMVRYGLFLEHGCELVHNDSMRAQLQSAGGDPDAFGWASIQLDGGMEKVLDKVAQWFESRIESDPQPVVAGGSIKELRLGLLSNQAIAPHMATVMTDLVGAIVTGGGTVVVPSNATLLTAPEFSRTILGGRPARVTLAYGQAAARPGLHVMDAPSSHWVETLTGLGATGVEVFVADPGASPEQGHPFIPLLQLTTADRPSQAGGADFDFVLKGSVGEDEARVWNLLEQVLARKLTPRVWAVQNTDVQITRGLLGVSV